MTTRTLRSAALATTAVALGAGLVSAAGPATGAPAPRAQTAGSSAPSASPSASVGATATPSASASPPASAAASPTGAPSECTVETTNTLGAAVVVSGRGGQVGVRSTPGATLRLFAASLQSQSYFRAREAVVPQDGRIEFTVTPPTTTRLYAQQVGCDPAETLTLGVRMAVGISAFRHGARDYTFSGGVLPRRADQLVSLFRVTASGTNVLTARTRTDSAGRWAVRRAFTGSGRFGFVARTGANDTNLAGTSIVRPTVIH